MSNIDLDLKRLMGENIVLKSTDYALDSLLKSIENFSNTTTIKGTGNIFDCAISLGDLDFDLNLDFFNLEPSKMDYILLKKIAYLRRLITNINNIFINIIQDLECCTGDDRYNRTIIPIFKWLVEDENGLCGTLLRISKEVNKIYIPLKRILCLFRNIPGNPTIGLAGIDYLKFVYPIVDGLEKVMNLLDNGRFLDILIIPVKDFHDKLIACSSGKDTDFYTGYSSLKDIISNSIYDELTINLIDEIKRTQNPNYNTGSKMPIPPTPPIIDYNIPAPTLSSFKNYSEFSNALYDWNRGYSEFRKDKEREYNNSYSQYLLDLQQYRKDKFESTLTLNNERFENSTFAAELMTDSFKDKHRAICGCLGEIFRLDGYFIPTEHIIRNEADLNALIGEVEYRGVRSKDYYINSDEKKIKIINASMLEEIRTKKTKTSFEETMMYPFVKNEYLNQIAAASTIDEVIKLNENYTKEINEKTYDFRRYTNYYDSLNSSFYSLYLNEIENFRKNIAFYKNGLIDEQTFEAANKSLYNYSEYPPADWIINDKELSPDYQRIFGNITYKGYLKGIDELKEKQKAIEELKDAYGRNHAVLQIVDNTKIECGCDLLCMVIKYIINLILSIIKKLISYITNYLIMAISNKELQWWIKFITEKIKCIIDILNISKDIQKMEDAFNAEMRAAKNSIKKAPESIANCSTSSKSIIDELNLYQDKAKVNPDTIKDINWSPDIYPELRPEDGNYNVTPNFDNAFNIITENVSYENTQWKNRTIPTMILDCTINHKASVDWVPKTGIWKAFLNIELNINQFNSGPDIPLLSGSTITEEETITKLYHSLLYQLFETAVSQVNFIFKIETSTIILFETDKLKYSLENDWAIFNGIKILFSDVKRVWFKSQELDNQFIKVYDIMHENSLKEFQKNITDQLIENLSKLKETNFDVEEVSPTSSKYCSPTSLRVKTFEPLYNDSKSILYPGEMKETNFDTKTFIFTPKEIIKRNVPFLLVFINSSGQEFTVIALVDICHPSNILKEPYELEVDGMFLNGRYDYYELDAIPFDQEYILTEKDLITKLKGYLENIGAISSSFTGPLSDLNIDQKMNDLVDNTKEELLQSLEIDIDQNETIANQVLQNLPNGPMKNALLLMEKISQNISDSIEELNIIEDLANDFNVGITPPNIISENIFNTDPRLGIPLIILNEEENIVLTIHKKKLKLININSNFGLNSVLETDEIDYKEGEQLFIEYSTNGFEHTISWLNERKVKSSATIISVNQILLKPTQIGSYYKDGQLLALMCGKIHDIIFTESNNTPEEWFNNSNTYRPSGTIGYYDFSVFDGYHVYSIPEFFRVTKLNSIINIKGILYESKEYTREEIMAKIQDNKFNEILSNEVTIVGERPISVGGNFIWSNKKYYKNVSFGHLENFFCRDNLAGESFTISFWLKLKDAVSNNREDYKKKYIFSDTHTGNFIWIENDLLHIQLFGQYLRTEPVNLLFIKDLFAVKPEFVEKWYHHCFRYDKNTGVVYYNIKCIDQKRNFDPNYEAHILDDINIEIPLINTQKYGKKLHFSLVTMLARFDVEKLNYQDYCWAEITALAIWKEYKDDKFIKSIYDYQKRIIINEMD